MSRLANCGSSTTIAPQKHHSNVVCTDSYYTQIKRIQCILVPSHYIWTQSTPPSMKTHKKKPIQHDAAIIIYLYGDSIALFRRSASNFAADRQCCLFKRLTAVLGFQSSTPLVVIHKFNTTCFLIHDLTPYTVNWRRYHRPAKPNVGHTQ